MPATPVLSNGGTGRGLPICCYLNSVSRQPRGHRRHLERECLAGVARRRHRHLLGQCARHRRAGRPQRQDQRHHPVRPRDGQPDAGDSARARCAAARPPAISTSRHPEIEEFLEIRKPSGDFNRKALNLHHGVLITDEFMEAVRDGAECVLRSPKDGSERATVDARSPVPEAGRDPPRDRRALHHLHRPGEPVDAQASPRPGPQGLDLEPVLGNHAADRHRPSRRRPHRGLLPVLAQPRDLGRVERRQALHRGRHALPRQCAEPTISTAPPTRWRAPNIAPSASARSASA